MTADPYLNEITQQVINWDAARARSQQKAIGWSEIGGCRAAIGYELNGAWATDDVDVWAPIKGTALHDWLRHEIREPELAAQGLAFEHELEVSYRGIPGHVDEIIYTTGTITDWKFPALKSARLWDDPEIQAERFIQPQGYAAAVIRTERWRELAPPERRDSPRVQILVAPVDGRFRDWRLYEQPFDQAVADAAIERYQAVEKARAEGHPLPRDMPVHFCQEWCEFFTLCRGGERQSRELPEILDPELATAIERYGQAHEAYSAGEKVTKELRSLVYGLRGRTRGWQISTGKAGYSERPDMEQIKADYEASGLRLPMRREPRDGQLRVTRVKEDPDGT